MRLPGTSAQAAPVGLTLAGRQLSTSRLRTTCMNSVVTLARSPMKHSTWSDLTAGDDASFEQFVAGSSRRLFTMARLLTGGHYAEAEDLLQGAFERTYGTGRGFPARATRNGMSGRCWSMPRWTGCGGGGGTLRHRSPTRTPARRWKMRRRMSGIVTSCFGRWRNYQSGSEPFWCCATSRTSPKHKLRPCSAAASRQSRSRPGAVWQDCARSRARQLSLA